MTDANDYISHIPGQTPGLTKREYVAAMAMHGLLASWGQHDLTSMEDIAHDSVIAADALINALNETP